MRIMVNVARIKKHVKNYLFDHRFLKNSIDYTYAIILATISAFLFAFGYTTFVIGTNPSALTFVTGGFSGVSQNIILIAEICGFDPKYSNYLHSILYISLNIPLLLFSFKYIGFRFSFFSLIQVGLSSVFVSVLTSNYDTFGRVIAEVEWIQNSTIARCLFAGVCIGFSSALAFKGYFSAGGIDVIAYFISLKKSNGTGKYSYYLNAFVITVYCILSIIYKGKQAAIDPNIANEAVWAEPFVGILFAAVYLLVTSIIVDLINVRNKKVQLQIVTSDPHLSDVLLANFAHGITISQGVGAYSKQQRYILYMAVTTNEVKKVIKVVKSVDSHAFVEAINLHQVYGNFYIDPIK